MYKRTVSSAHFIARTGSHSTKGHRNGRVDVLPPNAIVPDYTQIECDIAAEVIVRIEREF